MRVFILKRLIISVIILFFVMLIIYSIIRLLPTSYVEAIARERSQRPGSKSYTEWLAQLNTIYGLDKGILAGFLGWLKGVVTTGNFGDSWVFTVPVIDKFKSVIWNSFFLSFTALFFQVIIAIPLGILSARKQYSKTDYAITVLALIGISLPGFFFASLLRMVLSDYAGLLDWVGLTGRYHMQYNQFGKIIDILLHTIMPLMTLIWISIGGLMRYTRTNMLEVLNSDYIRTARAKGLPESRVVNYHAFRNTLIPVITMIGGTLPGLFGGSLITETIFQIPGIGYTGFDAMKQGDIPFSMFYMSFLAVLTLLGTLIADILYAVVDPRVRVAG